MANTDSRLLWWSLLNDPTTWNPVVGAYNRLATSAFIKGNRFVGGDDGAPTECAHVPFNPRGKIGYLLGWRIWSVDHGRLRSIIVGHEWLPGCALKSFNEGAYAFKDRDEMLASGYARNIAVVLGQVALWGKIVEYGRGYRAQYAYPYSFDVAFNGGRKVPLPDLEHYLRVWK